MITPKRKMKKTSSTTTKVKQLISVRFTIEQIQLLKTIAKIEKLTIIDFIKKATMTSVATKLRKIERDANSKI